MARLKNFDVDKTLSVNTGALMLSNVLHISVMQILFTLKSYMSYMLSVDMNKFWYCMRNLDFINTIEVIKI